VDPFHPARAGHIPESPTTPSSAPIYQTTAFDVPDLDVLEDIANGRQHGHVYTRDSNPNHTALMDTIAAMENAEAGGVFASGMSAIGSVFLSLTSTGDHVILSRSLYGRTLQLADRMRRNFGISVSSVDPTCPDDFRAAVTEKTRFALVESIANPLLEIADLQAISAALGEVPLVVDSTFTTPELIRPCDLGAGVVIHSASKYLNGHGDVMLGVAAGRREIIRRMNSAASLFGQNANPFETWLCQRGLRTLALRIKQVCATTIQLIPVLSSHPAVARIWHPFCPDHPSHEIAQRLYPNGTGGIISIELQGTDREIVNRFLKASESIPFSPTLADARTTVSWPAGTSHRYLTPQARTALGIPDNLIRLSVGLEPLEMLAAELTATLNAIL
jgi:cystathionine beta-lyase/cystathionine gamma-synthase